MKKKTYSSSATVRKFRDLIRRGRDPGFSGKKACENYLRKKPELAWLLWSDIFLFATTMGGIGDRDEKKTERRSKRGKGI